MSEREPNFYSFNPDNQESETAHQVVVASPADLDQLNAVFPPPEDDPQQHKDLLAQQEKGEIKFFVLKNEDEITGTASLMWNWQGPAYPDIKGPHIMGVQIAEKHRGQHLPDKLLAACAEEAIDKGYTEIYTGAHADNKAAITAYQRNGFTEIPNTRHTLSKDIDPDQVPQFYMKKSLE